MKTKQIVKKSKEVLTEIFTPMNIAIILLVYTVATVYKIQKVKAYYIYKWWDTFNGPKVIRGKESFFDISNYVYRGYAPAWLNYVHTALFVTESAVMTETEFDAYQTLVFSKIRYSSIRPVDNGYITDVKQYVPNKELTPFNCITPYNLFETIAIGSDQRDWFRGGIIGLYGRSDVRPTWYNSWVSNGMPGPIDDRWKRIMNNINCNGFWPTSNNCRKFFDAPKKESSGIKVSWFGCPEKYDVSDNVATSQFVDASADEQAFYQPGNPNSLGSWAQLFADWGCIFTKDKGSDDNKVNTDTVDWAVVKRGEVYANQWDKSTSWDNGNDSILGLNFFGVYGFVKESTAMIGWVLDTEDERYGQKLDSSMVANWLSPLPGQNTLGGWIHELRSQVEGGSGLSLHDITTKLFTNVSQGEEICLKPPPTSKATEISQGSILAASILASVAAVAFAGPAGPAIAAMTGSVGVGMIPGVVESATKPSGKGSCYDQKPTN